MILILILIIAGNLGWIISAFKEHQKIKSQVDDVTSKESLKYTIYITILISLVCVPAIIACANEIHQLWSNYYG